MKELKQDNRQLKRLVADLPMDKAMLEKASWGGEASEPHRTLSYSDHAASCNWYYRSLEHRACTVLG